MYKRKLNTEQTLCSEKIVDSFKGPEFCHRISDETVLSDLPDDLLYQIFKILDPESLVKIAKLKIERLDLLQYTHNKSADFSQCNSIDTSNLNLYLNIKRVEHLKELNFNNLFNVRPNALLGFILRCKNITKLCVLNSGLYLNNIINILKHCTQLEELYFSMRSTEPNVGLSKTTNQSLKKLYLQIDNDSPIPLMMSRMLLEMCPNASEVVFNASSCYVTSLPPVPASRHISLRKGMKVNEKMHRINFVLNLRKQGDGPELKDWIQFYDHRVDSLLFNTDKSLFINIATYHSAFLQFCEDKESLQNLPTLPPESVKSMVIYLQQNLDLLNYMCKIKKMTGNALKHLTLYNYMSTEKLLTSESSSLYMQDVLGGIVANSCNITVLDLTAFHTPVIFQFSYLCNLKNLKVCNLSTCCFALSKNSEIKDTEEYLKEFQMFVNECNKVETFFITDCKMKCQNPLMNTFMSAISSWKHMKYLTINKVTELRDCGFLIHVARSCVKLTSLELVQIGVSTTCPFMQNVKYVLKTSKELKFLRLNQDGLYPMDLHLWNNIEFAQKLEGICLATKCPTYVVNKTITRSISKLPRLHLFHLTAINVCGNLRIAVKKEMTTNGIMVPDIKIRPTPNVRRFNEECIDRHLSI